MVGYEQSFVSNNSKFSENPTKEELNNYTD